MINIVGTVTAAVIDRGRMDTCHVFHRTVLLEMQIQIHVAAVGLLFVHVVASKQR